MRSLEKRLLSLDEPPLDAAYRVALGLVFGSAFRAFSENPHEVWIVIGLFIGALLALRVGPAIARRILPFSIEAKNVWAERRNLSKRYDSYQWQKLFWIGLGMSPFGVIGGRAESGALVVTLFCLIGGCAGLLVWRRVNAAPPCSSRPIAAASN